jgi:outer membrane biosynthesis protein TonB
MDARLVMTAVAVLTLAATTGCGGGSGEARPSLTAVPSVSLPSATRSVTASPSRSGINPPSDASTTAPPTTAVPTTAPPTTAEPTTAEPTTAAPTTAAPTSAKPTSAKPTSAKPTSAKPTSAKPTSAKPTTDEPTTSTPPTSSTPTSAAATTPATAATSSDEDSSPTWPLYALLAAVVAGVVGFVVAARRRSARRDWTASLDGARAESQRLARDLAPSLLADSRESRRGGWAVARPGAVALEDRLAALARSAPDVADSTVAADLAAAVGNVVRTLDQEVRAPEGHGEAALRAAQDAVQRLEAHLDALGAPSPPGPT